MTLLALTHATKRFTSGQREMVALDDVSLEVDAGECVAVYGLRRSGRTTLLRIAAGILPLDEGELRFGGQLLPERARGVLGVEIGWCNPWFDPAHGGSVADHVAVALLARGAGRTRAREQAGAALARAGASACAGFDPRELHADELRARARIARALVTRPRLLLLDEPTNGVDVTGARRAPRAAALARRRGRSRVLMTGRTQPARRRRPRAHARRRRAARRERAVSRAGAGRAAARRDAWRPRSR